MKRSLLLLVPALAAADTTSPGPYPPAAGQPGSDAIAADDARFVGWAKSVAAFSRGWDDIADPLRLPADYGAPASALGSADLGNPQQQPEPGAPGPFPVVSLGDGGSITLRFDPPIADGPGADLAVFENGLTDTFLELAFVEVSSDGAHFVRFPAVSCTQVATQVGGFGPLDARNLKNLAGKYRGGFGTPFDLAELAGAAGLNVAAVTHVRVVDVVGTLAPAFASRDATGRAVNDPYPTPFGSGGFDLDAVGALHVAVTTFPAWLSAHGVTATGPADDPDRDGVPNAVEYAFGTDPGRPSRPPEVILTNTGNEWSATFPACLPGLTDVACGVEWSTDLKTWTLRPGLAPLAFGAGTARFCRVHVEVTAP